MLALLLVPPPVRGAWHPCGLLIYVAAPKRPLRTKLFAPRRASWERKLESRNLSAVSDGILWTPSLKGKI